MVDIGNTRLKWTLAAFGRCLAPATAHPVDDLSAIEQVWQGQTPQAVVMASAGGDGVCRPFVRLAKKLWGLDAEVIGAPPAGVAVQTTYRDPAALGIDRWLAMLGARHYQSQAACVIDAGTATTFDVIDANGVHLGGLIVPGVAAQQAALAQHAPRLGPLTREAELPSVLAHTTSDALLGGLWHGSAAAIVGLCDQLEVAAEQPLQRLITGGNAARLQSILPDNFKRRDDLVLEGLASLVASP